MTTAELGVAVSDPMPIGSRRQSVQALGPQNKAAGVANPTVTVNYNPQHGNWTWGGSINSSNGISVSQGNNTVTFNLESPPGAVFASSPFSWSGGQQPVCISNIQGGLTTSASFTDNNTSLSSTSYGVEVTILLNYGTSNQSPVTSTDPTIINEGTGTDGDGDGDQDGDRGGKPRGPVS